MREGTPPPTRSTAPRRRSVFMRLFSVASPTLGGSLERRVSATWNTLSTETFGDEIREAGGIDHIDFSSFTTKEIPTLAAVFHVSMKDAARIKKLFENLHGLDLFSREPDISACLASAEQRGLLRTAERLFPGLKVDVEVVRELAHRLVAGRTQKESAYSWNDLKVRFFRERLLSTGLDNLHFETISRADVGLISQALHVPRPVAVYIKRLFSKLEEAFLRGGASYKVAYLVKVTNDDLHELDYEMRSRDRGSILFPLKVVRALLARTELPNAAKERFDWRAFQVRVLRDVLRHTSPWDVPLVYLTGPDKEIVMDALDVDAPTATAFRDLAWLFRDTNLTTFEFETLPNAVRERIEHAAKAKKLDLKGTRANFKKKGTELSQSLRLVSRGGTSVRL